MQCDVLAVLVRIWAVNDIELLVELIFFVFLAERNRLKWLISWVILRRQFPKYGKLANSFVLDLSFRVGQFGSDDIAEDAWKPDVKLFQQLHNLQVVTGIVKHRPKLLDNVLAVVLWVLVGVKSVGFDEVLQLF